LKSRSKPPPTLETTAPQLDYSGWVAEAKSLHRAGRLLDAQRLYEKVLKADESNAEALHFLGLTKHQQGDGAAAVDLMYRAIAADPNSPEFHSNFGAVLLKAARLQEALQVLNRALELKPQYPEAYDNLAIVLEKQGKIEEAIAAWEKSIAIQIRSRPLAPWKGAAQ
jgi:tetratricopeptide (TPR) repeat protein